MKAIWIIFKKEFKMMFKSPLFYVLAFLTTLLMGITFSIGLWNFTQQSSNSMMTMGAQSTQMQNVYYVVFVPHLSLLNLVFIFLIPALSMRLIAEEKKNHTFDLLMTSPVTSLQIVLGKIFSLFSFNLVLTLITLSYMLWAKKIFDYNFVPLMITTVGIYLVSCVYSSICLFSSSLTENTVISFFLGVIFNILIWVVGGFSEFVDSILIKGFLEQISLNLHLQSLVEGAVKLSTGSFFVSVIILFIFLTERVIESHRWRAS